MDLRKNSDYFLIQHYVTGFFNRDGVCLVRGTSCIFIFIHPIRQVNLSSEVGFPLS